MSFSTNFEALPYTFASHYDNIFPDFAKTPEARAAADRARMERRLHVPEFSDSTPLDLFDRDGRWVEGAPSWTWEGARTTVIPHPRFNGGDSDLGIPGLEDVGGVSYGSV